MAEFYKDMQELDDLFASARKSPVPMPDHLTSAILADAVTARAEGVATKENLVDEPRQNPGMWRQLLLAIGGLPALGGLTTACLVGIWVGFAPPSFIPDPLQLIGYSDSTSVPYDSYDLALMLDEEVQ